MTPEPKRMSRKAFAANMVATALFFPALTLLLAGNWRWVEGWILGPWLSAMIMFSAAYLFLKNPALLAERARRPGSAENQKQWDRYLLPAIFATAIIWLFVLPLDAGRFHWSPAFPLWLKAIGGLALVPAFYLIQAATIQNTYLSTMVRLQPERKQQVVSTGVYGFVRHPLYLGCMLMMLGAPLLVRFTLCPDHLIDRDDRPRRQDSWRGEDVGTRTGRLRRLQETGEVSAPSVHLVDLLNGGSNSISSIRQRSLAHAPNKPLELAPSAGAFQ